MWQKYFKVVTIVPGPVIIPGHGKIDLACTNLDVDMIKQLYENDCHYFQITPLGLAKFYGIDQPEPEPKTLEHFEQLEQIEQLEHFEQIEQIEQIDHFEQIEHFEQLEHPEKIERKSRKRK